jgi:hypothetical protein
MRQMRHKRQKPSDGRQRSPSVANVASVAPKEVPPLEQASAKAPVLSLSRMRRILGTDVRLKPAELVRLRAQLYVLAEAILDELYASRPGAPHEQRAKRPSETPVDGRSDTAISS